MINDMPVADAGAYEDAQPIVRPIGPADLRDALSKGLADFNAMPTHLVFLCVIYPLVTLVFARIYAGYDVLPLVFPLIAGYTLIGPLVAVGMYELSRRREKGLDFSRRKVFHIFQRHAIRSIAILGALLMVIYLVWLVLAWTIYVVNFGSAVPESVADFALQILTTGPGWAVIIIGGSVGFFFAVVVFSLSVISFPMVLDRDVSVMTAMQTSIRAVLLSPVTMALWGCIVVGALFVGSLPFFVGLCVVLPVLGHATWHIYRKAVEPDESWGRPG